MTKQTASYLVGPILIPAAVLLLFPLFPQGLVKLAEKLLFALENI